MVDHEPPCLLGYRPITMVKPVTSSTGTALPVVSRPSVLTVVDHGNISMAIPGSD